MPRLLSVPSSGSVRSSTLKYSSTARTRAISLVHLRSMMPFSALVAISMYGSNSARRRALAEARTWGAAPPWFMHTRPPRMTGLRHGIEGSDERCPEQPGPPRQSWCN